MKTKRLQAKLDLRKATAIGMCCLAKLSLANAVSNDISGNNPASFSSLSFEQLSQIEITTISRRTTSLAETPAAVTVLSGEDILRSGAKSVAESLRQVPGLMVGQVDANSWAISSRGFNSELANKMLIMMDGRSVYSPLFSGTFWDVQNVMLEDLEKIEVIRGPGSTLWGANAVNGVINIVTKNARDTQGGLLYGGGGYPQQALSAARYGGKAGANTYYRIYSLYQQSDAFPLVSNGKDGVDPWNLGQGGFRLDHETAGGADLTWQGDTYFEYWPEDTQSAQGANTLGRYNRVFSDTSGIELQAYVDYTYRRNFLFETPRTMADFDFQHNFALGERNALLWGLGYRMNYSEYRSMNPILTVNQEELTAHLVSGFIQDEISIVPEKFSMTPGLKLEYNNMTGAEPQPGIRLALKPAKEHLLWASVSRAVRMPGDGEYFGVLSYPAVTASGPGHYSPDGNVASEKMIAYETGYRLQIQKNLSADLAAYYNDYSGIISTAYNGEKLSPGVSRITSQNMVYGGIYGGEFSLTYRPLESWRLTAWYGLSFGNLNAPAAGLSDACRTENRIPTHQAFMRSSLDLTRHWQFDSQLRYVDNVETAPAYIEADMRLAWRPIERLELALVGQNLLHESHKEFRQATNPAHAAVPRGFYAKLTLRF